MHGCEHWDWRLAEAKTLTRADKIAFSLGLGLLSILSLTSIVHDDWYTTRDHSDSLAVAGWLATAPLPHLAAIFSARQSPETNPILSTLDIIPRNLAFLVVWTVAGSRTIDLEGTWLSLFLVYLTFTVITLDSEVSDLLANVASAVLRIPPPAKRGDISLPDSAATSSRDPDSSRLGLLLKSRKTLVLALLPAVVWFLQLGIFAVWPPPRTALSPVCTFLPDHNALCDGLQPGTIDIVIAYYAEPIWETRLTLGECQASDLGASSR